MPSTRLYAIDAMHLHAGGLQEVRRQLIPSCSPPARLSGGFVDRSCCHGDRNTIQRFIVAPVSRSDTSQSRRASAASPAAAFGVPRLTPSK